MVYFAPLTELRDEVARMGRAHKASFIVRFCKDNDLLHVSQTLEPAFFSDNRF